MKKYALVAIIVLLTIVAGSALFFASHRKASIENSVHTVSLLKDHAEPAELLIKAGDTVQFNSKDGLRHNLGAGTGNSVANHQHDDDAFESGQFGSDEAYRARFSTIGVYYLHDHLHPDITVTVAVYDPKAK